MNQFPAHNLIFKFNSIIFMRKKLSPLLDCRFFSLIIFLIDSQFNHIPQFNHLIITLFAFIRLTVVNQMSQSLRWPKSITFNRIIFAKSKLHVLQELLDRHITIVVNF